MAVFYSLNKGKTNIAALPVSERYHNDVTAGGDKAVLELADGKKIVLDNASTGELAQQGAVSVVKSDSGKLVYKVGKTNEGSGAIGAISYNTITTPKGGQYQVILPDGSKVWLNAASSLRFPTSFAGSERRVELIGEGYFQIEKDKSKPFRVKVSPLSGVSSKPGESIEVEVLGTEFDLMAYTDEDRQAATLVSGEVVVRSGTQKLALKPDQQVVLNKQTSSLNLIDNPNVETIVAWKDGVFKFQDASIESIMRQAARWYDIEVAYSGEVKQQFKGTVPRQVNLSTLLQILEATGWVHFRIDGKRVTVFP
ncbi:MAG TPA: FecR domain-containing protein [Puia sp.]|nr:FecR domain-containing protein [Puia sp.]